MPADKPVIRVAVATPLRRLFDYSLSEQEQRTALPGMRVSVPFGRRGDVTGMIISCATKSDYPRKKIKPINRLIDHEPLIDQRHLNFIVWASCYYHHPVGEVIFGILPVKLRKQCALDNIDGSYWTLSDAGKQTNPEEGKISPAQAQILGYLQKKNTPVDETELRQLYASAGRSLQTLVKKALIIKSKPARAKINSSNVVLNGEQKRAVDTILETDNKSSVYLLDGVTGSGKTEVYMVLIKSIIKTGRQCLILLPEIGLMPQLLQRLGERFNAAIAVQHSALSASERLRYWQQARSGEANIIVGTRSAVWTPLANPGLYIIDEEHDLSYKQQDGFRYSARDILITRAARDGLKAILGSATPSLESLYNVKKKHYIHIRLTTRAGASKPPEFRLLDMRGKKVNGALSETLVNEIKTHLKNNHQVLLFLNRRGYAIHLYCHYCAWKAECPRCERPYTYHKTTNKLKCHHCNSSKKNITHCPQCDKALLLLGNGTERIEEQVQSLFPQTNIARIDRDTMRKSGKLTTLLKSVHAGEVDILIGTQMLSKGHHFPDVTLTAIIDADRGLFSNDFRAGERLAQLLMQVSGRTGRGMAPGTVIIQTHYPEHPLFHTLIQKGYRAFSNDLLRERQLSALPPTTYMALLRAEAHNSHDSERFLEDAAMQLTQLSGNKIELFGPIPAIVEKRSGRFRHQLVIQSENRNDLHKNMDQWLTGLELGKSKVRWSLDIDPQDIM